MKEEHTIQPTVFISTGTGVAPFVSMIVDLLEKGAKQQLTLICGYRHETLYNETLLALQATYVNFKYVPILSKPTAPNYTGPVGRVQQLVIDTLEQSPNIKESNFYICGLYEMIEQTCRSLVNSGVSRDKIHFERYD